MVINDFDLFRSCLRPSEADAELIIDPDRMLTGMVALERLKAIIGRCPKLVQDHGGVHHFKLASSDPNKIGWKSFGAFAPEDSSRCLILETADHKFNVSYDDTKVQQCICACQPIHAIKYLCASASPAPVFACPQVAAPFMTR
jgi:hypothetical protein